MIVQITLDEAVLTTRWRSRLAELGDGLKVGLAWKTPAFSTLRHWGPILAAPGACFVSLEPGATSLELLDAVNMFGVMIHGVADADVLRDNDQLMALIEAHDLVITVDEALATAASELEIPCWKLLAGAQELAAWQPHVRLFRPGQHGGWPGVMTAVAHELEHLVVAKATPGN